MTIFRHSLPDFEGRIWSQFTEAVEQICVDLGVPKEAVEKNSDVYGKEFFYDATGSAIEFPSFSFSVRFRHPHGDLKEKPQLDAYLEITYADHVTPFYVMTDLGNGSYPPNCLVRWAAWAVHQFNLAHNPTNLDSLFGEAPVRVYGVPFYSRPTRTEMQLLMWGLQRSKSSIIVHRFRHLRRGDWYRSYSYAIWAETNRPGVWVFFYEAGGLDSGGAYADFDLMQQLIKDLGDRVIVKDHDIESKTLERFLLRRNEGFEAIIRDSDLEMAHELSLRGTEDVFGDEFSSRIKTMNDAFEGEDYGGALRDLRAIMQDALERVARLRGVDISSIPDPDVTNLAGRLVGAKVLDGRLMSWFHAFTSIANLSSHKLFPTDDDWRNPTIRMRILTGFAIGRQLLIELIECARQKC